MAKTILQAVGENSLSFDNQCFFVTDRVKTFLNKYRPGMEVDITVRDVNGTPMVTFIKQSGVPPQGQYQQPRQFQAPAYQQPTYPMPVQPAGYNPVQGPPQQTYQPQQESQKLDETAIYALTGAIAIAYNLDINQIADAARMIKKLVNSPYIPSTVPASNLVPSQVQESYPENYQPE